MKTAATIALIVGIVCLIILLIVFPIEYYKAVSMEVEDEEGEVVPAHGDEVKADGAEHSRKADM